MAAAEEIRNDDKETLKQRQHLFAQADAACVDSQIGITLHLTDPADVIIADIRKLTPLLRAAQPQDLRPLDQWYQEVARLNNYMRSRWTTPEKASLVALLRHLKEALQSLLSSLASQTAFTPVARHSMETETVLQKVNALLVSPCLRRNTGLHRFTANRFCLWRGRASGQHK